MKSFINLGPALALMLAFLPAVGVAGEEGQFKLEIADKEPPAELADAVKEQLASKSYTISDADGIIYEFWFAKEIPLKSKDEPRNILNNIPEISLVGAVNIPEGSSASDFREDKIDPGLKTLRLAMQPQDGNHMGTAPLNTFAIVIPHERDAEFDHIPDHDTMVEMSAEDTVAGHPPILFMEPAEETDKEFPCLVVGGEGNREWQMLALEIPAKLPDGETMPLRFHLVFRGVGDL